MIEKEKKLQTTFWTKRGDKHPREPLKSNEWIQTIDNSKTLQILHGFDSDTEEWWREYRGILIVLWVQEYWIGKHFSTQLLTASVSTTGVTPSLSLLTWPTVHLGWDPSRFF